MKRKRRNTGSPPTSGEAKPGMKAHSAPLHEDGFSHVDASSLVSKKNLLFPTILLVLFFIAVFLFWLFPPRPVKISADVSSKPLAKSKPTAQLSWHNDLGYDPTLFEEISDNDIPPSEPLPSSSSDAPEDGVSFEIK